MMRSLLLGAALLVFAPGPLVAGEYQHTRDGKTTIWNNEPKPGDEAGWSGGRDDEGYAGGFGTLTWFKGQKEPVKSFGIPIPLTGSSKVYARYFGNMVRGKFNGPVNVHTEGGKTAHAFFIDGARSSPWASGRAPSRMPQSLAEAAKKKTSAEPSPTKAPNVAEPTAAKPSDVAATATPTEGEKLVAVEKATSEQPVLPQSQEETPSIVQAERAEDAKPPPTEELAKAMPAKKSPADVSLFSLAGPPASLQTKPAADVSSAGATREETRRSTAARLTQREVEDLADAEAHARGYSPTEYGRADAKYNATDEIWSINYKPLDQTAENGRPFSITVDDKTKGIIFVPGK